jgi:hypothetical protein
MEACPVPGAPLSSVLVNGTVFKPEVAGVTDPVQDHWFEPPFVSACAFDPPIAERSAVTDCTVPSVSVAVHETVTVPACPAVRVPDAFGLQIVGGVLAGGGLHPKAYRNAINDRANVPA